METITDIKLEISSDAFSYGEKIPVKYTCDGEDINPPINIGNLPGNTNNLALIVEDPDAPNGTFDHWVVWNIPKTSRIEENSTPGTTGKTSFGRLAYGGPCPPDGEHRYFFRVYALQEKLNLSSGMGKRDLLQAMEGKVLAEGELMGVFNRNK